MQHRPTGGVVLVEMKTVGQAMEVADRPVALSGPVTLRALLAELVAGEISAYDVERQAGKLLRILTPADLAVSQSQGKFSSGGRTVPAAPSLDVATERAFEAFRDGLYFVFIDGRQLEDLNTELSVTDDTRLRLVRLVALAGG